MKKVLAILLLVALVLSCSVSAFAATLTCPECKSKNVTTVKEEVPGSGRRDGTAAQYQCDDCGYEWAGEKPLGDIMTGYICSSAGLKMSDYGVKGATRGYHTFTPIDLTKNGTTNVKLVLGHLNYNTYIAGYIKVNVNGDDVTCTYVLENDGFFADATTQNDVSFVTFFTSVADMQAKGTNTKTLTNYGWNKKISIANDLGGAKVGLLFVQQKVFFPNNLIEVGRMFEYYPDAAKDAKLVALIAE